MGDRCPQRATHCGSLNDWDALGLQPKGVPVSPAFRNTLGASGDERPRRAEVQALAGHRD